MQAATTPEPQSDIAAPASTTKHYLQLFNRQKIFLREVIVESEIPLTDAQLEERYDEMYDELEMDVWPAKIGWNEWATTPYDPNA